MTFSFTRDGFNYLIIKSKVNGSFEEKPKIKNWSCAVNLHKGDRLILNLTLKLKHVETTELRVTETRRWNKSC